MLKRILLGMLVCLLLVASDMTIVQGEGVTHIREASTKKEALKWQAWLKKQQPKTAEQRFWLQEITKALHNDWTYRAVQMEEERLFWAFWRRYPAVMQDYIKLLHMPTKETGYSSYSVVSRIEEADGPQANATTKAYYLIAYWREVNSLKWPTKVEKEAALHTIYRAISDGDQTGKNAVANVAKRWLPLQNELETIDQKWMTQPIDVTTITANDVVAQWEPVAAEQLKETIVQAALKKKERYQSDFEQRWTNRFIPMAQSLAKNTAQPTQQRLRTARFFAEAVALFKRNLIAFEAEEVRASRFVRHIEYANKQPQWAKALSLRVQANGWQGPMTELLTPFRDKVSPRELYYIIAVWQERMQEDNYLRLSRVNFLQQVDDVERAQDIRPVLYTNALARMAAYEQSINSRKTMLLNTWKRQKTKEKLVAALQRELSNPLSTATTFTEQQRVWPRVYEGFDQQRDFDRLRIAANGEWYSDQDRLTFPSPTAKTMLLKKMKQWQRHYAKYGMSLKFSASQSDTLDVRVYKGERQQGEFEVTLDGKSAPISRFIYEMKLPIPKAQLVMTSFAEESDPFFVAARAMVIDEALNSQVERALIDYRIRELQGEKLAPLAFETNEVAVLGDGTFIVK